MLARPRGHTFSSAEIGSRTSRVHKATVGAALAIARCEACRGGFPPSDRTQAQRARLHDKPALAAARVCCRDAAWGF